MAGSTDKILIEVAAERQRQDAKWGRQDHDLIVPVLAGRSPQRWAEEYEIPGETRAKFLCQTAAARGVVTWPHIIVEEVAEFVAAADDPVRAREELIQVAACAVAAIEAIDRQEARDAG